jgi:hypothetical protein
MPHQFLQIIHCLREAKKVGQQVLGSLRRFDELTANGHLMVSRLTSITSGAAQNRSNWCRAVVAAAFGFQFVGLKLNDLLVFVWIFQISPLRTKSHL